MFVYSCMPWHFKPLIEYTVLAPCVSTLFQHYLGGNSYLCVQFSLPFLSPASGVVA